MARQNESKFKSRVIRDLDDAFGDDIKILATQERGRCGVLDLNLCLFGDHIEIELKVDGEKPTKLQQINIDKVLRAGGIAFCSTPSEWDHHLALLKSKYAKAAIAG